MRLAQAKESWKEPTLDPRFKPVVVDLGRTNIITISVGYDLSDSVVTSQIREEEDRASPIIAEWAVTFKTNGVDGELVLTMDNLVSTAITKQEGYMDLKRVVNGEPFSIFAKPILVKFQKVVTV